MNKLPVTNQVLQTAILRFMSDGSVTVKLSGVDGITAKKLEIALKVLERELSRQRALSRQAESVRVAKAKQDETPVTTTNEGA